MEDAAQEWSFHKQWTFSIWGCTLQIKSISFSYFFLADQRDKAVIPRSQLGSTVELTHSPLMRVVKKKCLETLLEYTQIRTESPHGILQLIFTSYYKPGQVYYNRTRRVCLFFSFIFSNERISHFSKSWSPHKMLSSTAGLIHEYPCPTWSAIHFNGTPVLSLCYGDWL